MCKESNMAFRIVTFLCAAMMIAGCASGGGSSGIQSGGAGVIPNPGKTMMSLAASSSSAQYDVIELATLGGTSGTSAAIKNNGVAAGFANETGDHTQRATLWPDNGSAITDLGTLGGPNSAIAWSQHNDTDVESGIAERHEINPLGEAWSCSAFFPQPPTLHVCVGVVWHGGIIYPLDTLGGYDGYGAGSNESSEVVGWAENMTHDPTCNPQSTQVLQFKPVYWDASRNIHELPTFGSDPDGAATAVNSAGDVVGISGICDQAVGRFTAHHALLWRDGKITNLGNLGGVAWNTPGDINNRDQVAGFADLPGDSSGALNPRAFLWPVNGRMKDLGTLHKDNNSIANGINDYGQVVGLSIGSTTTSAFIWQNGRMTDLNCLIPRNSGLYLLEATDINDRGEIVGEALDLKTKATPGFLLIPRGDALQRAVATQVLPDVPAIAIPASVRAQILQRYGYGR
jgi:probable HAF family extracellular repeat protein